MELLDRVITPILADPIIIILLVMLIGSLSIGSVAGKKADAQEKIQRRLKYVTNMRSSNDELRINQSIADLLDEEDQRPSVLARVLGMLAPLASQLPLVGEKDREKLQKSLIVAGYRSSDAINLMLAAKMASGIVVGMVIYAAVTSGAEPIATGLRGFLSLPVGIVLGAMAPEFIVRWQAGKRQKKISQAVPDALDLMVICAEAGLTMETALHRVSRELKAANPELALELATTEAELKILPQRKTALENLVYRTDAPEMAEPDGDDEPGGEIRHVAQPGASDDCIGRTADAHAPHRRESCPSASADELAAHGVRAAALRRDCWRPRHGSTHGIARRMTRKSKAGSAQTEFLRRKLDMTGKYRRTFGPAAAVAMALGLAGCQSLGGMGLGIGQSSGPSKAEMIQDEVDRNIRLAKAAQRAGQHEVALGIYSKLLRIDPAASEFRAATGEIYFEQGAHAKSLAAFDSALSGDMPTEAARAEAYVGRGRARLATGDASGAERDFTAAVALNAASAVAINGLGVAADMQGQHAMAQAHYRDALALDPGNERVRSNLGLSLALAARFDDAVAQLAPLATTSESAQKARYNLALTFGLMGRPTEARELVATAIAPGAADGNGLFYAATRDAVTAEAARYSVTRPDANTSNDLSPRRQQSRSVANEALPETPAAGGEAQPAAKPIEVDERPITKTLTVAEPPVPQKPVAETMESQAKPVAKVADAAKPASLPMETSAAAPAKPVAEPPAATSVFQQALASEAKPAPVAPAPPVVQALPEAPAVASEAPAETVLYMDDDMEGESVSSPEVQVSEPQQAEPKQGLAEPTIDVSAATEEQTIQATPSVPAAEPTATSQQDVTAFKSPQPVVTQHLDKNDAFYAAMRNVVDELAKPMTPWGERMRLDGSSDQLAAN